MRSQSHTESLLPRLLSRRGFEPSQRRAGPLEGRACQPSGAPTGTARQDGEQQCRQSKARRVRGAERVAPRSRLEPGVAPARLAPASAGYHVATFQPFRFHIYRRITSTSPTRDRVPCAHAHPNATRRR